MRRSTSLTIIAIFVVLLFIGYAILFWPRTLPRLKFVKVQYFSGYTIVTLRNISGQDLHNVTIFGTIMRDYHHFDLIRAGETFDVQLYGTAHSVAVLYNDGLREEFEF